VPKPSPPAMARGELLNLMTHRKTGRIRMRKLRLFFFWGNSSIIVSISSSLNYFLSTDTLPLCVLQEVFLGVGKFSCIISKRCQK
jgi:hypothetical protein